MGNVQYSNKDKADITAAGAILTTLGAAGVVGSGITYGILFEDDITNSELYNTLKNNQFIFTNNTGQPNPTNLGFAPLLTFGSSNGDVSSAVLTMVESAKNNNNDTGNANSKYRSLVFVDKANFYDNFFRIVDELISGNDNRSLTYNGAQYTFNIPTNRSVLNRIRDITKDKQAQILGLTFGGIGGGGLSFISGFPTLLVGASI